MSRKLASIKQINDIQSIEGKDRIELAIIDGWQVIVQKGEYEIGDKTVFIEIDSMLPDKPEFEFLRKKKFRIKTMKLGKTLSQGICFPLSILTQDKTYNFEDDVTEIIGIKKYEPNQDNVCNNENSNNTSKRFKHPIFKILFRYSIFRKLLLSKKQNKGFPSFISKTDEPRIQCLPHILKNKDTKYVEREKIDGSSITLYLHRINKKGLFRKEKYDFGVCSRNLRLWYDNGSHFWQVAHKYNIKTVLEKLIGDNEFVAIQGEVITPRVQGNKYKVTEPDLYVFNLIYPFGKINCICGEKILKRYGIKWCPLVNDNYTLPDTVNELLDYVTGKSQLHNTLREGSVFRNYEKNVSFKAVSPDFLIKNDE